MRLVIGAIVGLLFAGIANAEEAKCSYPIVTLVSQSDASGNTSLANTPGCAVRVVQAINDDGKVVTLLCNNNVNDPLIAVVLEQAVSAFGVHVGGSVVERVYCASQLKGR